MISIINYGLGNINAFLNVYKRLNIPVSVATSKDEIVRATRLILPGVGSFDNAIERFERSGMKEPVVEMVFEKKVPIIGVCVGMQMLACSSEEGKLKGLGWVTGEVKKFSAEYNGIALDVPHMGWNNVIPTREDLLFKNVDIGARFYFLHSYFFSPKDDADTIATATYGAAFCCAVRHENIYGVQFHPEKSHLWGIRILENFAKV